MMFKQYAAPTSPSEAADVLREVEAELAETQPVAALADCATWDARINDLKTFANVLRGFAAMTASTATP